MVWGGERLHITVGRAGFWDHRGGREFASRTSFSQLRGLLEADDEEGIGKAFSPTVNSGGPERPMQLGCGRLELTFSDDFRPVSAELDIRTATLVVILANGRGEASRVVIRQAMDDEIAWIDSECLHAVHAVPTWDFVAERLSAVGCLPPERWDNGTSGGFCQTLPSDDPLALAWEWKGSRAILATALGPGAAGLARNRVGGADIASLAKSAVAWWSRYWEDVPDVRLPDPALQHTWLYGVYKQAGLTTPGAVPATLQGPWMEEYQIPPWSNDYHFNINLQMIYWPALGTNRLGHFGPLWDMVRSWLPNLRDNAGKFFGVPDALMLPHAVDDRCQVVGSFWTGTIDHACTAWVAQMAWLHYRYSMDESLLRELAWPMLCGAFNGYWAMLEERTTGGEKHLSLPVSVSPEFGGAGMNAWGRDASFQLAACHFLARTLREAARILGEAQDERWEQVTRLLPPYCVETPERGIALWQGRDFDESHRHHSHLASIYPFGTIDPLDSVHRETIACSMRNWTSLGAGAWTGWCVPWASILCSRCGLPDAAVVWLDWWKRVFTNIGHGTLHDADFSGAGGLTGDMNESLSEGLLSSEPKPEAYREIMQIDAGMGAVTAIIELLVQCHGDSIAVLPAIPSRWRDFQFDGIRTEGAFLVGATVKGGRSVEVRVKSLAGSPLRLAHGMGGVVLCDGRRVEGHEFVTETVPGREIILRAGG